MSDSHAASRASRRAHDVGRLSIRVLILSVGVLLWSPSHAGSAWENVADPVFQHPISDSALPNSPVLAITQDNDGFLWVGTEDGVARWDGYRYRVYHADRTKPAGLPDNYIQSLHVDTKGTLWIATLSGGLSRYDRQHDRFVNYGTSPQGLSGVDVRGIADDGVGGVWVATNHGLDEVSADRGVFGHLRHDVKDAASLPDDNIEAVLRDSKGRLWIGILGAVIRRDLTDGPLMHIPLPSRTGEQFAANSLWEDAGGRIWIGTKHGAYVLRPESPNASLYPELVPGSENDQIESIAEGRRGEIWLGTYGNGISIIDETTFAIRRIRHDPLLPQSLDEDTLWALYRDRAGDIWTGTNRGFSRYDPNQAAVLSVFGVVSRSKGLSDGDVESVLPMPNGQLWAGLGAKGVDILDPVAGRVAVMRTAVGPSGKLLELSEVRDLVSTESGEVFFCTRSGLYRKSPDQQRPVQIPLPGGVSVRTAVVVRETGTLWLGTIENGLWTLKLSQRGQAQPWPGSAQLTDPRISVIERGASGSLWVGTQNGLNHIDPATGAIERIVADPGVSTALSAPNVSSLMIDRQGRLWVGTLGGGISILENRDQNGLPRFRHLGLPQGLPNLNIDKMLQTPSGTVWVATDRGLAMIDPERLEIRSLGQAEGVAIPAYWENAGAITADGTLAFGGSGGLTLVRPERLASYDYHPSVVVSEIRIGGKLAPWGAFDGNASSAPVEIAPDANSLTVEFAALDYSSPERNRYAYRLEGYDDSWVETDFSHRIAAYTNLPPGSYVLHLRGSNRDGAWTERVLSLPIQVRPAWYQTIWFRIGELLAATVAGLALLRSRTAYLRTRQRELERQVASQTARLRERERQLEQLAYLDPLTGLANRRMLTKRFDQTLEQLRQNGQFALATIDLDRFKAINDSLGHDAGDALLIEVARRLRAVVRDSDDVFRLGGDEFAILFVDFPDDASVETVCRRIIEEVCAVVSFNGIEMSTSPSIGIARFPRDGDSLGQLFKVADLALYEAKREGRNTWRWGRGPSSEQKAGTEIA